MQFSKETEIGRYATAGIHRDHRAAVSKIASHSHFCFWIEASKTVVSSLGQKCHCQIAIQSLSKKLDEVARTVNVTTAIEKKQNTAKVRATTQQTPITPRVSMQRTPKRLTYAAALQKETRVPRQLEGRKSQPRMKPQPKARAPCTGASKFTSLKATETEAPPRIRQKALFVTNLAKETTELDVACHLRKIVPENVHVQVTKLRSANQDYYASFHVSVPQEIFADINDRNVWPVYSQFRPYRGQLQDYRRFETQQEESPRRKQPRLNAGEQSMSQ